MEHNNKHNPKVLFILKKHHTYGPGDYGQKTHGSSCRSSYGLLNSCKFLINALTEMGIGAKFVEVVDNNSIDHEVSLYKPTHVFIEALWVVPSKFNVLIPLHPRVKWYVRLHSNVPFLANEGIAIGWIAEYANIAKKYSQFHIAPNSHKLVNDLSAGMKINSVYAPNIYSCKHDEHTPISHEHEDIINIGCFGAIRPLKNQLIQAMAAIAFADEIGKKLKFHINSSRIEQRGDNVAKNLVSLFENTPHELIGHDWMSHKNFCKEIKHMDLGLQVSFSETFNIVAADFASLKIPIVGSAEIEWMSPLYQANPTDLNNIVSHLWLAWLGRKIGLQSVNAWGLNSYNTESRKVWKKMLDL